MRGLIIGLGIVAVLGIGAIALGPDKATTQQSDVKAAVTSRDFSAVQSDVSAGAQLLDVRTPDEFAAGHFEKAVNMPLQDIQAGTMPSATKDTAIYVYCRSGNRSAQAATALKAAGYTKVVDLGGLSAVQAIGGTLVK